MRRSRINERVLPPEVRNLLERDRAARRAQIEADERARAASAAERLRARVREQEALHPSEPRSDVWLGEKCIGVWHGTVELCTVLDLGAGCIESLVWYRSAMAPCARSEGDAAEPPTVPSERGRSGFSSHPYAMLSALMFTSSPNPVDK